MFNLVVIPLEGITCLLLLGVKGLNWRWFTMLFCETTYSQNLSYNQPYQLKLISEILV